MRFERDDLAAIADEYVLGLLDPADTTEVEAEMTGNAALGAAIAASRERFLPLDTTAEAAAIGPELWRGIEARLPPSAAAFAPTTPVRSADNDNGRWRRTAFGAMAASVVLALGLTWSLLWPHEPVVIAVLLDEAGAVQAIVEDFGNDTASVRLLTDITVPQDKTMQVWTLPSQDMGPMSLGLLAGAHSALLESQVLPDPRETQLYEITLEPAGGSPSGRPTGPILAKGFARAPR